MVGAGRAVDPAGMASRPRRARASTKFQRTEAFALRVREVGQALRAIRLEQGLTLEEVAARMEGDFRHLQRIERGQLNVTFATLMRVAEALDVDLRRVLLESRSSGPPTDPVRARRGLAHAAPGEGAPLVPSTDRHGRDANIKDVPSQAVGEPVGEGAGARGARGGDARVGEAGAQGGWVEARADEVMRGVGEVVVGERRRRGLTQVELAGLAGMTVQHLQRIERGTQNLTLRSLVSLANALRLGPTRLLVGPMVQVKS